jgi:phosphatidylserine/phosphatidylglycerophosphate/cardiolipin synthase-like enzyme
MRSTEVGTVLTVRGIAGLHVVILAWDYTKQPKVVSNKPLPKALRELLGFSIVRAELTSKGEVVERYPLRGMKRFKEKDEGLPPGTLVSLEEHPVQSFLWGDYTAKPGTTYQYTVTPIFGTPKLLDPADDQATTVEITTEKPIGAADAASGTRHDVWFNRGVIGSQAYARKFPDEEPDPEQPESPPMKWLSRGLYEALLRFIGRAKSDRFALRGAFYEFHYQPVADAFREAMDNGADVKITYDAESSYKDENLAVIKDAGLNEPDVAFPRTVTTGIRHNKFIVLVKDDKPIAVWTGSTNISDGGIFGHSNVGHVVWDRTIAAAYLEYWDRVAANQSIGKMRAPNRAVSPLPPGPPPPHSVLPVFSPRDPEKHLDTLQWYADRMAEAERLICITLAFTLHDVFSDVLSPESDVLRYLVKDDALSDEETVGVDHDLLFAAGGRLDAGVLANFLEEPGNPLNSNDYIHNKFFLVDPLGVDPLVVCGSANFSPASQQKNDENMLVIRGDTRVADIYFGEFMRIFDHHYARYIVKKLADAGTGDPDAGFLKTKAEQWLPSQFNPNSYKSKRRKYFVEQ